MHKNEGGRGAVPLPPCVVFVQQEVSEPIYSSEKNAWEKVITKILKVFCEALN